MYLPLKHPLKLLLFNYYAINQHKSNNKTSMVSPPISAMTVLVCLQIWWIFAWLFFNTQISESATGLLHKLRCQLRHQIALIKIICSQYQGNIWSAVEASCFAETEDGKALEGLLEVDYALSRLFCRICNYHNGAQIAMQCLFMFFGAKTKQFP